MVERRLSLKFGMFSLKTGACSEAYAKERIDLHPKLCLGRAIQET